MDTAAKLEVGSVASPPRRAADRLARAAVRRRLARIERGSLLVVDGDGATRYGAPDDPLRARILVRDPEVWRALLLRSPPRHQDTRTSSMRRLSWRSR